MIRLMNISELDDVVALSPSQDSDMLKEMLPHLNVYVYDEEGIQGFCYIVDGYIVGDLIVASKDEGFKVEKALLTFLKTKYDELLFHTLASDSSYQPLLEALEFQFEELILDEESGLSYNSYAWIV